MYVSFVLFIVQSPNLQTLLLRPETTHFIFEKLFEVTLNNRFLRKFMPVQQVTRMQPLMLDLKYFSQPINHPNLNDQPGATDPNNDPPVMLLAVNSW